MSIDLVGYYGDFVLIRNRKDSLQVLGRVVATARVAGVCLYQVNRVSNTDVDTHHHDRTCTIVTEATQHRQIRFPIIFLVAIIETDPGTDVRQERGVLCETRSGQQDV